ncbi:hypothetical protein NC653_001522 [Populus alba x Populus x berolinensis]|uniref:Uncharacterized protein n=1 Tax=Populus alba x Populus x berolinensis TaxID=444605 RepID=A0AAD6RLN9_9ROSI|nr:hypothetical protein NC653_001522 [Populus alba x Populus x berolinensis]
MAASLVSISSRRYLWSLDVHDYDTIIGFLGFIRFLTTLAELDIGSFDSGDFTFKFMLKESSYLQLKGSSSSLGRVHLKLVDETITCLPVNLYDVSENKTRGPSIARGP